MKRVELMALDLDQYKNFASNLAGNGKNLKYSLLHTLMSTDRLQKSLLVFTFY